MSKNGIRLSPKHGVNPSLAICFYCGEDTGEVILPGRLPDDAEAPRKAVWHKDPCPTCAGYMKQGVILISVKDETPSDNPYRTGGFVVLKDEAVQRMFTGTGVNDVLKRRVCFVPDQVWDALGLPRGAQDST